MKNLIWSCRLLGVLFVEESNYSHISMFASLDPKLLLYKVLDEVENVPNPSASSSVH